MASPNGVRPDDRVRHGRPAVEALKLGACDYLTKPFEPEAARSVLLRALARAEAAHPSSRTSTEVLPGVIARSRAMQDVAELIRREATTLILCETGAGKERIARAVHELSPPSNGRLVALNFGAVPAELRESELFGYGKGAVCRGGCGAQRAV